MSPVELARTRLEAALELLERVLRPYLEGPATVVDSSELEELRRRCAALEAELERLAADKQRLREQLQRAIEGLESAARAIEQEVEG